MTVHYSMSGWIRHAILLVCLLLASISLGQSTGSIVGVAFKDANGDGIRNPGELGYPSIGVRIMGPNVDRTLRTSSTGSYSLGGLAAGMYTVMPTLDWKRPLFAGNPAGFTEVLVENGQRRLDLAYDSRCAKLELSKVFWDYNRRAEGGAAITIRVLNCTEVLGDPFSFAYVRVKNLPPGVTVANPPVWNGAPGNLTPLAPNQARLLTLTFTGLEPETELCFDLEFHSLDLAKCCCTRTCIRLPECECFQLSMQRITCLEGGRFKFDFSLQNLDPLRVNEIIFGPKSPMTALFDPMTIPVSINPGGYYTGSTVITGVTGGETICFYIGLKNVEGVCCSKEICIKVPFCGPCVPCEPDFLSLLRDFEHEFWMNRFRNRSIAATTCWSDRAQNVNNMDYVLGLVNLEDYQNYPWTGGANGLRGTHWPSSGTPPQNRGAHAFHNEGRGENEWNRRNLGSIFGLCIDDEGNMYVAQTSSYNVDAIADDAAIRWPGAYLHGRIFKIDAITGNISLFNVIPTSNAAWNSPDPAITWSNNTANVGLAQNFPELGDVTFGIVGGNRFIFASNLEDGRIYSHDMNGNVIASFDHGMPDNGSPGFAAKDPSAILNQAPPWVDATGGRLVGEMVWAVELHCGRLYYSLWNEDLDYRSTTRNNEVWSVGVNTNGTFKSDAMLEVVMPSLPVAVQSLPAFGLNDVNGSSAPVSDISFSPRYRTSKGEVAGGRMMVAERGMGYQWQINNTFATWDVMKGVAIGQYRSFTNTWPHAARGMEFLCVNNRWVLQQGTMGVGPSGDTLFAIGEWAATNSNMGRNSAGGVDYDPENLATSTANTKGPRVWFTADFMVDTAPRAWYGIQGIPRRGGRLTDSIVVDANELANPAPPSSLLGVLDKAAMGDVEMGVRPRN